jgi:CHAT domain-containing protein
MIRKSLFLAGSAAASLLASAPLAAQPLTLRDSFPIGSAANTICSAQLSALDRAFGDIFDRGYQVICRDAAAPVATLYVLRLRGGDPGARLAALRREKADCTAAAATVQVADLRGVTRLDCTLKGGDVGYRVYAREQGGTLYVAEGLAGYDGALQLGLRSLVADRPVPGEVSVALTGADDPVAFARAQAGTLDPRRALNEAYRRNNAGAYAEAGEFFASLLGVEESGTRAEAVVNQALQSSNLGRYPEAEALFARAMILAGTDPVLRRRLRNYVALHLLNQGELSAALAELDRPLDVDAVPAAGGGPVIDGDLAARLNAEAPGRATLDRATAVLSPAEKIQILDGQRLQLRGTVLRLQGRNDQAVPLLEQAATELAAVRGGVVASTIWMRAQINAELAAVAEARGDSAEAERLYRAAVTLLATDYPGSDALLSARARLASFYARSGRSAEATALYRDVVAANVASGTGSAVIRRALEPYFALLTQEGAGETTAADLFLASQVALRPGVAQTLAVLARELSGGSDEAARLFRQSVALNRDVERTRVAIARAQIAGTNPPDVAALRAQLAEFEAAQVATQARLTAYPRFRAIAPAALPLAELQQQLRPDEAYYKLAAIGRSIYAVLVTPQGARAFKVEGSPDLLEERVDTIRATISLVEDGENVTYPFDVETAHLLYRMLFEPVAAELAGVRHLIFEPDGAMLRLPANLLVEDAAASEAARRRAADPDADPFDFTAVRWFGRSREISTAVSPRAFRDVRSAPPSRAANEYLGLGQNAPVSGAVLSAGVRTGAADDGCGWAIAAWNRPISASELVTARQAISRTGGGADLVTGAAFTDTAILQRPDLDQYRVMHFATHGLVTPPRPECPARPSLLTSFGGPDSDGLLSFGEIFDLRLDADLIILSACDTAGRADLAATREAGLTSGGDFALDGLVRAFVGAGGRLVVASTGRFRTNIRRRKGSSRACSPRRPGPARQPP